MDLPTIELITAAFPEPVCIVDETGMIIASNKAAQKMLALEEKPKSFFDCVSNLEHEKLKRTLQNWKRSHSPLPAAFNIKHENDEFLKCHIQGSLCQKRNAESPALILLRGKNTSSVTAGFTALNDKITQLEKKIAERRQFEKALLESEAQVRLLLDSAGEAIYGINLQGECTFANLACLKMLGYSNNDELLGKNMHTFIHYARADGSAYPAGSCKINQAHTDSKHIKVDNEVFWRKDGSFFPVEYFSHPILQEGIVIGSVVTFMDITERKQAEEKIQKLNADLEKRVKRRTIELEKTNSNLKTSLEQLQQTQHQLVESEKMAALGGLVAGIAHEINTPVGVSVTAASHLAKKIKNYAQQYEDNTLTREDFESLIKVSDNSSSMILANLERAADLIRSFKQIAVDQTCDEQRRFNLKNYLTQMLLSLEPELKKHQPVININCDNDFEMDSYPGAISQIFTNLIMNSLIHGFENMEQQQGRIEIDATSQDEQIILNYHDNGKGISPKKIKKIFEPFYTTKRNQGGSGLGMHIVYNLVNQTLGGTIICQAKKDEGAFFTIRLPNHTEILTATAQ